MKINTYKVFVNKLSLPIRLGCQQQERQHYQTAELDLEFELQPSDANFDLGKTVCYLTATELAKQVASEKEWDLIENFLTALASRLFDRFDSAQNITANLKKFIVPNCESAGASLYFSRNQLSNEV